MDNTFLFIVIVGCLIGFFIYREKKNEEIAKLTKKPRIPEKVEYDIYYRPDRPKKNYKEIFEQKLPEHVRDEIVSGYGAFLENSKNDKESLSLLRDVSELPYSKSHIEYCLLVDMAKETNPAFRDVMGACLIALADYQEGVGNKSVKNPLGVFDTIEPERMHEVFKHFQEEQEQLEPYNKAANKEKSTFLYLCQLPNERLTKLIPWLVEN